jgi:hypothetical protein
MTKLPAVGNSVYSISRAAQVHPILEDSGETYLVGPENSWVACREG